MNVLFSKLIQFQLMYAIPCLLCMALVADSSLQGILILSHHHHHHHHCQHQFDISFFSKVLNVTYSETFVWGPYTTRNINTLINKYIVWPTKKVSKNEVIKKIIFGLNSLYCPVIINKILTVIKGKKPISWLRVIALLTIGIKKCDNHTV